MITRVVQTMRGLALTLPVQNRPRPHQHLIPLHTVPLAHATICLARQRAAWMVPVHQNTCVQPLTLAVKVSVCLPPTPFVSMGPWKIPTICAAQPTRVAVVLVCLRPTTCVELLEQWHALQLSLAADGLPKRGTPTCPAPQFLIRVLWTECQIPLTDQLRTLMVASMMMAAMMSAMRTLGAHRSP